MTTKFILYGGFNPTETNPDNSKFSQEILKDAPENARVLVVPFAKEPDRFLPTFERVSSELSTAKWQNNIITESANEENLINQVKSADVIYFQGGSTTKLLGTLKNYSDLGQLLKGKIVAGDSAGGNALCKFFYSPKTDAVCEGLGIIPVKMISHYKEEYRDKFNDTGLELETVLLPEYTHKVLYFDII